MWLALIFGCSLSRAFHGQAIMTKKWAVAISALVTFSYHKLFMIHEIIGIIALFALGYSWGWGKWFSSYHGRYNRDEKEFWPIDVLIDPWGERRPYLAGVVGMSLRWIIFFSPMYIFLDYASMASVHWSQMFILSFVGPIYWICGILYDENNARDMAEWYTGALLGLSLCSFV